MLLNLGDGAVLTSQPHQQHAADVGMGAKVRQNLPGVFLIVPHLAASVGVREGVHMINAFADQILEFPLQSLGDVIDTAHGGQDPQLIADANPPVLPGVAQKGSLRHPGHFRFRSRLPGVLQRFGQVGLQVLYVDMASLRDGFCRVTDGKAVFDDVLPFRDIPDRDLVSGGNVLPGREVHSRKIDFVSGGQGLQSYRHVVRGMNAQDRRHCLFLLFRKFGRWGSLTGRDDFLSDTAFI